MAWGAASGQAAAEQDAEAAAAAAAAASAASAAAAAAATAAAAAATAPGDKLASRPPEIDGMTLGRLHKARGEGVSRLSVHMQKVQQQQQQQQQQQLAGRVPAGGAGTSWMPSSVQKAVGAVSNGAVEESWRAVLAPQPLARAAEAAAGGGE